MLPWEKFRSDLEVIYGHERKSNAGRRPFDVVMMFKILILQSLYNLSDDEIEYQIMDRLSFMRFPDMALDSRVPVSFSEERGESEGGQIPGASSEERMQRTSADLVGETREPDKSKDSFQNRTCIRGHDTASRKSHSEVHRDKQGGREAGITQHRIQHGEILLFDEADRIKGGFPEKKQIKCRLFQSRMLEKEKSKR